MVNEGLWVEIQEPKQCDWHPGWDLPRLRLARMGDPGVNLTPERLNRDFGRNGELKKLDQKLR